MIRVLLVSLATIASTVFTLLYPSYTSILSVVICCVLWGIIFVNFKKNKEV